MASTLPELHQTPIPGLCVISLPVHGDSRGWFKENWQREKFTGLGLEDFLPVQHNVSFNAEVGTTRGIHAEPWDKLVSVAQGKVFGAWVDLRPGPNFGTAFWTEMGPDTAVFVPRGVGNAFQALEASTSYSYLVNDHWTPTAQYSHLNLADDTVSIPWPIPLDEAELSDKDRHQPIMKDVAPVPPRKTLVLGANGILGRALRDALGEDSSVVFASRNELDITAQGWDTDIRWNEYSAIINAAAYTAADAAEADVEAAWRVNVTALTTLARIATTHHLALVHVSSDYVFDGTHSAPMTEETAPAPLSVYGETKAAGDAIVSTVPKHYVLRPSWVVGDGRNFVSTMKSLAEKGVDPRVVDDQIGRLTFAEDLAGAIVHLLNNRPTYGTYNLTNSGPPVSWAEVAKQVFILTGHSPERVSPVSTEEYFSNASAPFAQRPLYGVLDLSKIEETGFTPPPWKDRLDRYLEHLRP